MKRAFGNLQVRKQRSGAVTVEFLISLAILFATSLAIFQFFMLGLTQQLLVSATTEAARFGAMQTTDGSINAVAASAGRAAEAYLKTQGLELFDNHPDAADGSLLLERRIGTAAVEMTVIGDGPPCPTSALPTLPLASNQVRVTLCFPLIDATDPSGVGNPVGNWLSGMGFDLAGATIRYSATANLE